MRAKNSGWNIHELLTIRRTILSFLWASILLRLKIKIIYAVTGLLQGCIWIFDNADTETQRAKTFILEGLWSSTHLFLVIKAPSTHLFPVIKYSPKQCPYDYHSLRINALIHN